VLRRIWFCKPAAKNRHRRSAHTQCRAVCLTINTACAARNDSNAFRSHRCSKARGLSTPVRSRATRTDNAHCILRSSGRSSARPQNNGRQRNRRKKWWIVIITKHYCACANPFHFTTLIIRFHRA